MLTLFRAGGGFSAPSGFSCAIAKLRKIESSYLAGFLAFIAHILTKKSPGQVRSPEAIYWPHLRKVCDHARARVFRGSICSLQIFIRYHHAQFVYLRICKSVTWGQVRFVIFTLQVYEENIEMRPTLSKWVKTTQFFQNYDGLSHLWWSRCHLLTGTPEKVIWGHVRSSVVYCQ